MWFVVVVVLALTDGTIVTVAKEVDSRVQCDIFKNTLVASHPEKFVSAKCVRYKNGNSSGDNES